MDTFSKFPFSLKTGDYIVVRGAAINVIGQGPFSAVNRKDVYLIGKPVEVTLKSKTTKNNVSLSWPE
jgi:hypothetical protein